MEQTLCLSYAVLIFCLIAGTDGLQCYVKNKETIVDCKGSCFYSEIVLPLNVGCSAHVHRDHCERYFHYLAALCFCNTDLCNGYSLTRQYSETAAVIPRELPTLQDSRRFSKTVAGIPRQSPVFQESRRYSKTVASIPRQSPVFQDSRQ